MAKTYGILSDLHGIDISVVQPTLQILKNEGINSLVLNGDISGERSGYDPQEYLAFLLNESAKYNMDVFVLPGSHEQVQIFEPVLNHFSKKYSNIVNTFENQKIDFNDHDLVFIQGSDSMPGKETIDGYVINSEIEPGFYKNEADVFHKIINPNDIKKLITHPEKTIVFSHVPRKFDSQYAVDIAEFGQFNDAYNEFVVEYTNGMQDKLLFHESMTDEDLRSALKHSSVKKILDKSYIPEGTILAPYSSAIQYKEKFPFIKFELRKENKGNEELTKIFQELGITKNITGHFHESAGKANDLEGKFAEDGIFVNDLFYNAACVDRLMVGMVSVDGPKVAYENIDLRKYFKTV